jgi:hypothetical protein
MALRIQQGRGTAPNRREHRIPRRELPTIFIKGKDEMHSSDYQILGLRGIHIGPPALGRGVTATGNPPGDGTIASIA